MNMQSMLKQAQKMQKDMLKTQDEINNTIYEGKASSVCVKVNGAKEILNVKIDADVIEKDEIELFEDMIVAALNDAMKKINKDTEEKMGAYTKGMPGLF